MRDPNASRHLRRRPVDISGTVFLPLALPQVIEDCFTLLLDKVALIPDPFEQAFFLMVQLPYLQPFEDVNKRVSRIGANISLIRHNLCPLSFIDVPCSGQYWAICRPPSLNGTYQLKPYRYFRIYITTTLSQSCNSTLDNGTASSRKGT